MSAGHRHKIPGSVIAGLILAVVLDTFIQTTWKIAAARDPLASPCFYAAMLALVAQLFNWLRVLARADLSFAQPFTALGYITVLAISRCYFHESLSLFKLAGVGLILLGVFFISRTPSVTSASAP